MQQPSYQRAFAVIYTSCRYKPYYIHYLLFPIYNYKLPFLFLSSIAASDSLSSILVSPRSLVLVAIISLIISMILDADDSTAAVQVISPTVLYRTFFFTMMSDDSSLIKSDTAS